MVDRTVGSRAEQKLKMKLNQFIIATIAGLQFGIPVRAQDGAAANPPGAAQAAPGNGSDAAEIKALKDEIRALEKKVSALEQKQEAQPQSEQVQALDQKVRILERQRELEQDAATAAAKSQPRLAVGANGVTFSSADTNYSISLHGVLQVDSRTFPADGGVNGNDSFLLRRARPILQGTLFRDIDFVFVPDFGGSAAQIFDAYLNYRFRPELQLQAGKFKSPVGLEALQADVNTLFNERSLATDLAPNRDVGAELHGDLFGGAASWAAGVFNGAPDYSSTMANTDYDDNKAFEGRLFLQPWKHSDVAALQGLGFGVAGSYESDRAAGASATGLTAGYNTDGQQKFFTYTNGVAANGTHWRVSPQGYYYWGPFGLLGEYLISDQVVSQGKASGDMHNTAWEITGSWVLTGENASYNGVTPRHPFDPRNGGWGAWQLAARYAALDVDKAAFPVFANPNTSASAAHAWSAGLNWYLNRNVRVNASCSRTTFTGGSGAGATVTKQPENAIFTRIQLSF
jgi:phosphate-selective porin OprO/OprP